MPFSKKYAQAIYMTYRWVGMWILSVLISLAWRKQLYITSSFFCPKFLISMINFSPDNLNIFYFGTVLSCIFSPVIVTVRMVMKSVIHYREIKGAFVLLPSQYEEFKSRIGEVAENENLKAMFVVGEDALAESDGFLRDALEDSNTTTQLLIGDLGIVEERAKNLFDNNSRVRKRFRKKFGQCKKHFLQKLQKTDSLVHKLETATTDHVKHRHYSFYPSWRILLFNSVVFVQSYKTGTNSRDTIARIYKKRDPRYESFKNYFDNIWAREGKQLAMISIVQQEKDPRA